MQFNSKGKLAKFYMWLPTKDDKLPQDFCTYFWGLAGRALFVFGLGGMALSAVVFCIVAGIIYLFNLIWAHKIQTLLILGWFLILALMIWLSERKKKIRIEILSEAKAIIKGKVESVKNRYCPRIKWK